MDRSEHSVPREADLPPGYDEGKQYTDEDISTYPKWWQENIKEFQTYGMRPYRPPVFTDGAIVPTVVETLEDDLDVSIGFRAVDPDVDDNWTIRMDGEPVANVSHKRTGEARTEYDMSAEEFEQLIREAVKTND